MSSGARWALFSREDIPDISDPSRTYLTRWRILQTPWFGVFLHAIRLPDQDRHLHDHPWSFVSLVLRGTYVEQRPGSITARRAGSVAFRRAVDLHRILALHKSPVWTLVFVGPRRRRWGFQTREGWIESGEYFYRAEMTRLAGAGRGELLARAAKEAGHG